MFSSVVVTVGQQKVWFCLAKIAYCKKHLWPKNTVLGDKSCGDSKMCSFGHCQRAEMTWTWYIYATRRRWWPFSADMSGGLGRGSIQRHFTNLVSKSFVYSQCQVKLGNWIIFTTGIVVWVKWRGNEIGGKHWKILPARFLLLWVRIVFWSLTAVSHLPTVHSPAAILLLFPSGVSEPFKFASGWISASYHMSLFSLFWCGFLSGSRTSLCWTNQQL